MGEGMTWSTRERWKVFLIWYGLFMAIGGGDSGYCWRYKPQPDNPISIQTSVSATQGQLHPGSTIAPCVLQVDGVTGIVFVPSAVRQVHVATNNTKPPFNKLVAHLFTDVECQPPHPAQLPLASEFFMGMPPFWHHTAPGEFTGLGIVWLLYASAYLPFALNKAQVKGRELVKPSDNEARIHIHYLSMGTT